MLKKVVGAALVGALLATPALAAPITLKFNSPAPPPSFLHNNVFRPWIAKVEKASKGTLKIQLYVGGTLGNFKVNYDRVVDGVADIGFILNAFTGGKFKKLDVAELPFQSKNSTEAAYSLWKVYASGVANDEFDKVKPLAIWTFPNAALHTKKKITSLADVKGMRLATSNVETSHIVQRLGGVPVTFTPPDTYEAISRGIAGGTLMPFTGMRIFKVNEVTSHHLDEPLGAVDGDDVHQQEEVRFAAGGRQGGARQILLPAAVRDYRQGDRRRLGQGARLGRQRHQYAVAGAGKEMGRGHQAGDRRMGQEDAGRRQDPQDLPGRHQGISQRQGHEVNHARA